jgi:tetratricopeptide (TPR) repeat protein
MFEDYYQLLGISYQSDSKAIQKAFHKLAKELHPDRNPGNGPAAERFKKITEAYVTLSDPKKKSQYDLKLRYGVYAPPIAKAQRRRHTHLRKPRVSRSFYQKRQVFSRQARIGGIISIVAIIIVVAVTTVFFTSYNARFDFQKGLANYHNKRYSSAYFNLKESISPLNPYLAAAHLLMAEICYNQQNNLTQTRNHLAKAYQAAPSDSINARLLFLEGKIDYRQGDHEAAYKRFNDATSFLPGLDSATYYMGEMDLFIFNRFDKALIHFQNLAINNPENHEAYLASAYCLQQLEQHEKTITEIDRFLLVRADVGMAYYIKAVSAQALNLREISCANYLEADKLGVPAAIDSLNSYCKIFPTP